jgi:hypothetical protein
MTRIFSLFSCLAAVLLFGSCIQPASQTYTLEDNNWKLMSISTTSFSAYNMIYDFTGGSTTFTALGTPQGNGFTYTLGGGTITISGASEEGLSDGTYAYSISGSTMIWSLSSVTIYTFSGL